MQGEKTTQKNGTKTRLEIVRTLVELGEPVSFKHVKSRNKRLDKNDSERQLIYYHLGQLVKEGILLSEKDEDGETYYRCQPILYEPGIFETIESNVKLLHLWTKTKGYCSDEDAWKCLKFLIESVSGP